MKNLATLCFPVETSYLKKAYFTSYKLKWSHPIRLQDSLVINICGRKPPVASVFLQGDIRQGKVESQTTTFGWMC